MPLLSLTTHESFPSEFHLAQERHSNASSKCPRGSGLPRLQPCSPAERPSPPVAAHPFTERLGTRPRNFPRSSAGPARVGGDAKPRGPARSAAPSPPGTPFAPSPGPRFPGQGPPVGPGPRRTWAPSRGPPSPQEDQAGGWGSGQTEFLGSCPFSRLGQLASVAPRPSAETLSHSPSCCGRPGRRCRKCTYGAGPSEVEVAKGRYGS